MQKSTSDSLVKYLVNLQNGETRRDSITALDNLRDNHNFIFGYLGLTLSETSLKCHHTISMGRSIPS